MTPPPRLSDDALEAELKRLAAAEREAQAAQLALLAEFEVRGLPEASGRRSLYEYCVRDLGLPEGQAFDRSRAARASRCCSPVAEALRDGRLSPHAAAMLEPYLNEHTAAELIAEAAGKGKRELEDLIAELDPRPDKDDVVAPASADTDARAAARDEAAARLRRDRVEALSAERVHFAFTGSVELRRDIERARQLLWHRDPSGKLEAVVGALADFYLDREDPDRRLGLAGRAPEGAGTRDGAGRAGRPGPEDRLAAARSRLIPQAVKDEVWLRDAGRCAFVSKDGRRCEARAGLEYDHVVPWALGGRSDSAVNVRLLCRAHNQRAARDAGLGRAPGREGANGGE